MRDELIYLQGRHFYRKGDVDKALEMFGRVRDDSVVWLRAKFFQGVTLAARKFDGPAALEAFQSILVVGEERGAFISSVRKRLKGADAKEWSEAAINKEITQFVELTNLQLGRVFYSVRDYDKAIKYFEKIPQVSIDWPLALFEASWAYFMKNMNDKALGNIHSLGAPYFENEFFPEATILRAVIYYQYCLYDRALEAVTDYNDKYGPTQEPHRDRRQVRRSGRFLRLHRQGARRQGRHRQGHRAGRFRPCAIAPSPSRLNGSTNSTAS